MAISAAGVKLWLRAQSGCLRAPCALPRSGRGRGRGVNEVPEGWTGHKLFFDDVYVIVAECGILVDGIQRVGCVQAGNVYTVLGLLFRSGRCSRVARWEIACAFFVVEGNIDRQVAVNQVRGCSDCNQPPRNR